jgi:hypothetical protein
MRLSQARAIEMASVVVIAACVLLFGWALLQNLARLGTPAAIALGVLAVVQIIALRRNAAQGAATGPLRASRDVAFVAAIVLALVEVLTRQRWAIGATIAAVEFGLMLELFAQFAPARPPA